jgi:membrane protease YdiL (CAAX protease family)
MWIRVVVFYLLAFVITIVLGGVQEAAKVSTQTIILPQWGPGLAALLMLLIFRKDRFQITFFDRRAPASRYLLAALIPLGGAALVSLIYRWLFAPAPVGTPAPTPWLLLFWLPLGAIGEELGWRGYLHKRMNARLVGLLSSGIVGTLWALWHVGMYPNGVRFMAFFVLLMVSYSVVIYALLADSGFNVLLAAVFHLMINVASLYSYAFVNQVSFMMVNSLVWAVIAAVVVLTRKSLFVVKGNTQ